STAPATCRHCCVIQSEPGCPQPGRTAGPSLCKAATVVRGLRNGAALRPGRGRPGSESAVMRTLAIDLGARRIGLALSDEGARFATPLDVLQVTDPAQAIAPILALIQKESIQRLVIGLPLNMADDSLGPQAKSTIAWSRQLSAQAQLPIIFV